MNMMNTKIERVNPEQIDETIMEEAGRLIAEGELVAFPTETVYGLGGDALHPEAARKIYAAKGRPSDNPLIVHIADFSDMERVAREVPEAARKLAGAFWPGPLTMIVWKSDAVPMATTVAGGKPDSRYTGKSAVSDRSAGIIGRSAGRSYRLESDRGFHGEGNCGRKTSVRCFHDYCTQTDGGSASGNDQ